MSSHSGERRYIKKAPNDSIAAIDKSEVHHKEEDDKQDEVDDRRQLVALIPVLNMVLFRVFLRHHVDHHGLCSYETGTDREEELGHVVADEHGAPSSSPDLNLEVCIYDKQLEYQRKDHENCVEDCIRVFEH